ncbi:hypothetical protein KSP35_04790 [Aquihabitans sp. G128]|uniref:hypothetical protein n=1 Tax=Aquihabitans sp. G128 TaxID=2849779 RepID=UPI001C23A526|nr:hypothetical protein [Aquihabitans sp. G128]QXC62130.1 hypothetical protein KSP35_04790 [Aquihabitans sp. G128]
MGDPGAADGRGGRVRLVSVVGHLVVAVGVTAPLAWHLGRLPLGAEPVATVPQLNLWTLRWTADRAPHLLSGWWDAPIFWPQRGAFAFSEPQPLTGLAYALARPVFGTVGGYSFLLLATLALNGIAGAALARRLGATTVPAFLAGGLAQALPFVFDQLGVLQLTALWPLLAATSSLIAWLGEPRLRHALLLGASLAAAVGTCGYHALLFGLCLLAVAPLVVRWAWRADAGARLGSAAAGVGVVLLLAGPVALGQQERLRGRRWRADTILAGSASWHEWLPSGPYWPGWPLVLLATTGTALGLADGRSGRSERTSVTGGAPTPPGADRRSGTVVLLVLAVTSFLASLGSRLSVLGWRPWPLLVDHLDAVARLRSPFRAVAVTQVALVGLAVPAVGWLWDRRHAAVRAGAPAAVALAVLAAGTGSGPLVEAAPPPGRWAAWLAAHPDGTPVAFLPFAPGPAVEDFAPTTTRMLQALDTGHPMVNGYSGFFPTGHDDLRAVLAGFPDGNSTTALQVRGVRYVVVDTATFDRFDQRAARDLGFTTVLHDADAHLLHVPDRPNEAPG